MKKLIGIVISLVGGLAAMILWHLVGPAFEIEGVVRDRLGLGVNMAALVPLGVYCGCAVCACCVYKKRLDANSYQPLCHPVGLLVNAALQIGIMALMGFPAEAAGQASAAFVTAATLVVIVGVGSLAAAFVLGRPVVGKTYLPFVRHHQYQ